MKLEDIKRIAVLGAGTMGPGIAQSYAMSGREVRLYDISKPALDKARKMLLANLDTYVREDLLSVEEADAVYRRVSFTDVLAEALDGVQFVQETVAEKPEIKRSVFAQVDELLPPEGILVSNASSLDPFKLAPEGRKANFAAAHWFAPPQILPLVEVAKGEETSEETMETILALLRACGKKPVRLEKYVPGYIINRLQILLNTEVFYLLEQGVCTPEQLDLAVKASLMPRGMVLGLVQRYDFTGLDISASNIVNGSYVMPETSKHPAALFDHVDKGELGVKTGKGFYDYAGRSREELCARRDHLLFQVLRATGDLIDTTI
ncbi:3-hydroxyacyl-CoA dehydrogenase family protein [uncultured Flavonifractor sp.]|uniref:3-hydroxyacyl-CoA dehydrogenase family protein n=1 Tax=uncultured Flavonifractor sp. TaxID=1193534 RepID=UPI00266ED372|nr:3-hydroxyacyl-CoA dehydrogenase family protein [uncultured Flavonifractor sp.]